MTLQWTLTAGFLYGLMGVVSFMIMPFIPSSLWNRLFKSRLVLMVKSHSSYYFNIFLALLMLVLFEATRETYKKNNEYAAIKEHPETLRPEAEAITLMRMFRAQRNLHIAGFALFTWFIFRQLVKLISSNAQLQASQEATLKQARSATEVAQKLMTKGDGSKVDDEMKKELKEAISAREKAERELSAMVKQSENLTKEYDRVCDQCQELEQKLIKLEGKSVGKKDN